jgi:preprotein translocase subunit Sec63
MSSEYNYDEQVSETLSRYHKPVLTWSQGQFFPYFILTITGLVTLPLTYSVLKPSKGAPQSLRLGTH